MYHKISRIVFRGCELINEIRYASNYAINNRRVLSSCRTIPQSTRRSYSIDREAPTIDIRDVEKIVQNRQLFLLDVRSSEELREEGLIPTALNINVEELESALQLDATSFKKKYGFQKPSLSDHIIVYCRSGKRSARAGQIFLKHNFENVSNFVGSWTAWVERHPDDVVAKKK